MQSNSNINAKNCYIINNAVNRHINTTRLQYLKLWALSNSEWLVSCQWRMFRWRIMNLQANTEFHILHVIFYMLKHSWFRFFFKKNFTLKGHEIQERILNIGQNNFRSSNRWKLQANETQQKWWGGKAKYKTINYSTC